MSHVSRVQKRIRLKKCARETFISFTNVICVNSQLRRKLHTLHLCHACTVFNLLIIIDCTCRKYSKTRHVSISLICSSRLLNWPRSHMYLYDAEPYFSLEVLNPRFLICGINCGHKWLISTKKVRTSSIYFSYYL